MVRSKANIFSREFLLVGVLCRASDFCGAFTIDEPRARAINGLAIGLEPCAHLEQDGARLLGNGAVGFWSHVEQQITVFADHIDQLVDERLGAAVFIVVGVAPGVNADRGVSLPRQQALSVELAAFDVESGGILGEIVSLVGKHHALVAACRSIVVVSSEALKIGLKCGLADPPIEVEKVRMVFGDEF